MHAGQVDLLVHIGGNPRSTTRPADLDFAGWRWARSKRHVQLGLFYNETSQYCHWHLPQAHYLESWSDARAFDGTVSVVQPLIEPALCTAGPPTSCSMRLVLEQTTRGAYDIVRAHWQETQLRNGRI